MYTTSACVNACGCFTTPPKQFHAFESRRLQTDELFEVIKLRKSKCKQQNVPKRKYTVITFEFGGHANFAGIHLNNA